MFYPINKQGDESIAILTLVLGNRWKLPYITSGCIQLTRGKFGERRASNCLSQSAFMWKISELKVTSIRIYFPEFSRR